MSRWARSWGWALPPRRMEPSKALSLVGRHGGMKSHVAVR